MVVARGWGKKKGVLLFNGYKVLVMQNEKNPRHLLYNIVYDRHLTTRCGRHMKFELRLGFKAWLCNICLIKLPRR